MLYSTNHTISISTLSTGAKRVWTEVETDVFVYINQTQEDLVQGFDGAGSFTGYRMFTDGDHETISIGDRVTDEDRNVYEVKGKAISNDMMGIHHQYLLIVKYE